jgi:hypothetical protein
VVPFLIMLTKLSDSLLVLKHPEQLEKLSRKLHYRTCVLRLHIYLTK